MQMFLEKYMSQSFVKCVSVMVKRLFFVLYQLKFISK